MAHRIPIVFAVVVCAIALPLHGQAESKKNVPTFSEHVAPIIFARCSECHRPEQAGPMELLTFKDVRKRGKMIARVTRSRYMPPWHPVNGHGDFKGESRLTDGEIKTIADWVAGGMPEGDPKKTPKTPTFKSGWRLGKPDLIIKMPEAYPVPAAGPDIYRTFVIPLGLEEDKWVTAIEVRPSARTVVHHAIFDYDPRGMAKKRDARDEEIGFDSTTAGNFGNGRLGGWAVGGLAKRLPEGLARKLPAGADFVLESHFHPSGKKELEVTTLGLYFAKKAPERKMIDLEMPPNFGLAAGLNIPPGEANFEISDSFTLPVAARAITIGGHAHYVCREMKMFATPPNGEKKSIFYIDDWAFNWQNEYMYSEPMDLPAGTKIDVSLIYDNSAKNPNNPYDPPRRIRWGLRSFDEMGSIALNLVAVDPKDERKLKRAIQNHFRKSFRSREGVAWYEISRLKMKDRNDDGKISEDEVSERRWKRLIKIDSNGDGVIDFAELDKDGHKAVGF